MKVIKSTPLSGKSVYDFCPECIRALKKANPNVEYKKVLNPLICERVMETETFIVDGKQQAMNIFDNRWRCSRCEKEFSISEYEAALKPKEQKQEKMFSKYVTGN